MPTIQKFYLHDATTTDTGTLPGSTSLTGFSGITNASGASTNRSMDASHGAGQIAAGPVTEVATAGQAHAWFRRFCSAPLAAQTLVAGTWTFAAGQKDTGAPDTGNPDFDCGLFLWRPSTGALVTTVFQSGNGIIFTSTEKGSVGTIDMVFLGYPDVTVLDGDILVLEVLDDYNGTSGPPGSVTTFYYEGTTDPLDNTTATSAASYLLAPASIALSGLVITTLARMRTLNHL